MKSRVLRKSRAPRRVALIAGASRGIGEAAALRLARDGWDLALVSRTGGSKLERVAATCRKLGAKVFATKCDLSVEGAADFLVSEILWVFCRLDALVHCAGDYSESSLAKQSYAEWTRLFRSNLDTAFLAARAALKPMRKQRWGRVVFFGLEGIGRFRPRRKCAAYAAAKTALFAYTKSLALEEKKNGIAISTLLPGVVPHPDAFKKFRTRKGSASPQLLRIAARIAARVSSTRV